MVALILYLQEKLKELSKNKNKYIVQVEEVQRLINEIKYTR